MNFSSARKFFVEHSNNLLSIPQQFNEINDPIYHVHTTTSKTIYYFPKFASNEWSKISIAKIFTLQEGSKLISMHLSYYINPPYFYQPKDDDQTTFSKKEYPHSIYRILKCMAVCSTVEDSCTKEFLLQLLSSDDWRP